jgi:Holliday junction resolvase
MLCQKSGGKSPRQKGSRFECAVVRLLQDAGFAAEKTPLSGACGGRFSGDVVSTLLGIDRTIECKSRKKFTQLYEWLEKRDLLIIKGDRAEPLVVLPAKLALAIARVAEARSK